MSSFKLTHWGIGRDAQGDDYAQNPRITDE